MWKTTNSISVSPTVKLPGQFWLVSSIGLILLNIDLTLINAFHEKCCHSKYTTGTVIGSILFYMQLFGLFEFGLTGAWSAHFAVPGQRVPAGTSPFCVPIKYILLRTQGSYSFIINRKVSVEMDLWTYIYVLLAAFHILNDN